MKIREPNVNRGGVLAGVRSMVLLPKTNCVAPGARLSRVPETVTAGPPGVSIRPAIVYSDLLSAV